MGEHILKRHLLEWFLVNLMRVCRGRKAGYTRRRVIVREGEVNDLGVKMRNGNGRCLGLGRDCGLGRALCNILGMGWPRR